ncbi:hypothetical protein RCL1_005546 [Eukaryota sp. TZLM3-RCL]
MPLLEVAELYDLLAKFTIERFTIEKSSIPKEWTIWLITMLNKNESVLEELVLTKKFATIIPKTLPPSKLTTVLPVVLSPETIATYASIITEEYLLLWLVKALIHSWKESNTWTCQIFGEVLHQFDLKCIDPRAMISALAPLLHDEKLMTLYFEFVSTKLTPLLIRDYEKCSEDLNDSILTVEEVRLSKEAVVSSLKQREQELTRLLKATSAEMEYFRKDATDSKKKLEKLQSDCQKMCKSFEILQNEKHELVNLVQTESQRFNLLNERHRNLKYELLRPSRFDPFHRATNVLSQSGWTSFYSIAQLSSNESIAFTLKAKPSNSDCLSRIGISPTSSFMSDSLTGFYGIVVNGSSIKPVLNGKDGEEFSHTLQIDHVFMFVITNNKCLIGSSDCSFSIEFPVPPASKLGVSIGDGGTSWGITYR